MTIVLYILSFILTMLGGALNIVTRNLTPGSVLAQISEFPPVAGLIGFLKMVAYISTPILIGLIAWVISEFHKLRREMATITPAGPEISPIPSSGGALQARWDEISNHLASTSEAEWKFAVIEADKLLDDALRSAGYPGETMGERLMSIERSQLRTLDGLWDAHKTRNRLVHDANYFLRYTEAKRVVLVYEETLKELGAL